MSKNLTRKGLAFGAVVALGTTLFAGAPAHAAGEVVFEASAGTTYKNLLASTFVLNASLAPGQVASNISQLNYKVINRTNGEVTAVADGTGTDQTLATTVAEGNETTSTFTTGVGSNTLTVSTAGTATGDVEVIAFIDSDGDDTLDAGEYQTSRTITFVKPSEVTATTTLTKPVLGDASLVATVVLSGDINLAQVDSDEVTVSFSKTGTAITSYADDNTKSSTNPAPATFNSTAGALKAVLEVDATDDSDYDAYSVTAGTFGAQAIVASANSGSNVLQTAAARTIDNFSVSATRTGDAKHTTTAVYDVSASTDTDGAGLVRVGKGATVTATLKDASDVALASEAVTVVATGSGLATDTLTVNGVAVVDAAKEIAATTNASGQIVLTIDGATADDTDTLTIAFKLQGVTSSDYVLTWDAADYYAWSLSNPLDAAVSLVSAGTLAVDYIVVDQWGTAASSDYRLKFTPASSQGRTTASSWIYTPALVAGRATFNIVDNGAGASTTGDTVTVALEKVAAGGGYASATLSASADDEFVINYISAAQVAAAITASATDTTPALELVAVADADKRYQNIAAPGYTDATHVYGVATKSDGSALAGATLTVSAAGLLFQPVAGSSNGGTSEADNVFKLGSTTVVTNSSGEYEVLVYSNTSGKKTVTIAGAVSKTIDLTFDAADDNAGTVVTLTAPATQAPGKTFEVSATLADKFGNAITTTSTNTSGDAGADVSVTYAGPGFVTATLPAVFTSGSLKFNVLLGANDSGTGVVTVKYDANGDADYADTGDIVKTVSIVVAPAVAPEAAATITGATKKINLTIDNAKGEYVQIKVGNKTVKTFTAYSNAHAFGIKAAKGSQAVKVYVAGDLVAAKTVSVK